MNTEKMTVVRIDADLCKKIETLQFETRARQDLLSFMLDGRATTNSEQFQKYHDEYTQFFYEYEKAKEELQNTYVPEGSKRWELDFAACEVKIYA